MSNDLLKKAGKLDLLSLMGTIALLSYHYGEYHVILGEEGLAMSRDIIITLAIEFEIEHEKTNWEEHEWDTTVFDWAARRIEKENIPHRKF